MYNEILVFQDQTMKIFGFKTKHLFQKNTCDQS